MAFDQIKKFQIYVVVMDNGISTGLVIAIVGIAITLLLAITCGIIRSNLGPIL